MGLVQIWNYCRHALDTRSEIFHISYITVSEHISSLIRFCLWQKCITVVFVCFVTGCDRQAFLVQHHQHHCRSNSADHWLQMELLCHHFLCWVQPFPVINASRLQFVCSSKVKSDVAYSTMPQNSVDVQSKISMTLCFSIWEKLITVNLTSVIYLKKRQKKQNNKHN